jgi:heme-degrading monooxygenase HmoA
VGSVIARLWKGWTSLENADRYEVLLRDTVLPDLKTIDGYEGGFVLRRELDDEVEFAVLNLFTSLDAVRAFAGNEYEVPVFEPEARRLLSRVEPIARHYEVRSRT